MAGSGSKSGQCCPDLGPIYFYLWHAHIPLVPKRACTNRHSVSRAEPGWTTPRSQNGHIGFVPAICCSGRTSFPNCQQETVNWARFSHFPAWRDCHISASWRTFIGRFLRLRQNNGNKLKHIPTATPSQKPVPGSPQAQDSENHG